MAAHPGEAGRGPARAARRGRRALRRAAAAARRWGRRSRCRCPGKLGLGEEELELHPPRGTWRTAWRSSRRGSGVLCVGDYLSDVEIPWMHESGDRWTTTAATLARLARAGRAGGRWSCPATARRTRASARCELLDEDLAYLDALERGGDSLPEGRDTHAQRAIHAENLEPARRAVKALAGAFLRPRLLLASPSAEAAAPPGCGLAAPDRMVTGEFGSELQGSYVLLPFQVPGRPDRRAHPLLLRPARDAALRAVKHTLDLDVYGPRAARRAVGRARVPRLQRLGEARGRERQAPGHAVRGRLRRARRHHPQHAARADRARRVGRAAARGRGRRIRPRATSTARWPSGWRST